MGMIDELKKKPYNELTPKEKKLVNLNPIKKGEVRNPNGRTKGTKNWSTYFKKLMEDEEFLGTIISSLPSQWNGIVEKYPASVIAAGLIASTTRQVAESVAQNKPIDEHTLKMIDRVQRIGYGETKNVNVDTEEGSIFDRVNFNFTVVPDREKEES